MWGTSSLLALEFLDDDKVAILSGYPDIPKEQWLNVYDIPALYSNYPNSVNEYNYFDWYVLQENKVELSVTPTEGDYFHMERSSAELVLYGGTSDEPVLRDSYPIKEL